MLPDTSSCMTSNSLAHTQGFSPTYIPDVESLSFLPPPPLCDNHVKALVPSCPLRSRENRSTLHRPSARPIDWATARPPSWPASTPPPSPSSPSTLYCCLTTSSQQPPPPPSSSVISIHPYRTVASNPRSPYPRFGSPLSSSHPVFVHTRSSREQVKE